MAGDLIVLTFQGSDRAAAALQAVQRLAAHGWIELDDAVVALRSAGASDILVMPLTALATSPYWQAGTEAPLAADQTDVLPEKRFRAPGRCARSVDCVAVERSNSPAIVASAPGRNRGRLADAQRSPEYRPAWADPGRCLGPLLVWDCRASLIGVG